MTRWVATTSLLAVIAIGFVSRSTPVSFDRENLKGITSLFVLVEDLPDGARKLGLSEETVRTDVELKLRLAGLRVVTAEEDASVPGKPFLYVNVNATNDAEAASIALKLCQNATLARNGQFAIGASTWETNGVIARPTGEGIRSRIKDHTDEFLNDWLAANPKK